MEKELNIAAILKDKPAGTKLWSPIFGNCKFSRLSGSGIRVFPIHNGFTSTEEKSFFVTGQYMLAGEVCLFPSKQMQDWSKFDWKKGDVLVSNDYSKEVIFYDWYDDTYTNFYGKHRLDSEDKNNIKYNDAFLCTTERYSIEDKDAAQTYINTIEERLGGKLNRETLEVEKTQPEFKDGDIVCISGMGYLAYGIVKSIDNSSKKLEYYVLNDMSTLKFEDWLSFEDKQIYPITENQKMFLFDALAKKGKVWYAEKKQIVDLKPKWITPKPFDRVITRGDNNDIWTANIFSHMNSYGEYVAIGCVGGYHYCLPYNDDTAHLIGTTDEWKGGEG